MDRFIDYLSVSLINEYDYLKSNMDRFIVTIIPLTRLSGTFKIQYG